MRRSRWKSSALAIAAALERASFASSSSSLVAEAAVSVGDGEHAEQPRAKLDRGVHQRAIPC